MKAWPALKPPPVAWRPPPAPPRPPPRARGRVASSASRAAMSRSQLLQGSMNQHLRPDPLPFIDIAAQRRRLGNSIDEAVSRVLAHCQFINGPEVAQLEAELAAFSGARHVVTCASGTDALLMVLMARGVGGGNAVLCPSFTFCATGEAVALTGATPGFVDVDEAPLNMDANSLKRGIATAIRLGLKPMAVIPVDLFGKPPTMTPSPRLRMPKGCSFPMARPRRSAEATRAAVPVAFDSAEPPAFYRQNP